RCICGTEKPVEGHSLRRGITESCGCCADHTHSSLLPHQSVYNFLVANSNKQGHYISLTFEEFLRFTEIKECHYCGALLTWREFGGRIYQLDRKNNTVGYIAENCVACCKFCNYAK